MSELDNDLRATAEDIAADAAKLSQIEDEKAHLEADDPRMVGLSAESEQLARGLVPKTVAERELADLAASRIAPSTDRLRPPPTARSVSGRRRADPRAVRAAARPSRSSTVTYNAGALNTAIGTGFTKSSRTPPRGVPPKLKSPPRTLRRTPIAVIQRQGPSIRHDAMFVTGVVTRSPPNAPRAPRRAAPPTHPRVRGPQTRAGAAATGGRAGTGNAGSAPRQANPGGLPRPTCQAPADMRI